VGNLPLSGVVHYYYRTYAAEYINLYLYSRTRHCGRESYDPIPILVRGDPVSGIHPSLLWTVHAALSKKLLSRGETCKLIVRDGGFEVDVMLHWRSWCL
jgi:hypothetical protein